MFRGCDTPLWGHLLLFFYMLSLMVLFGNFYIQQYRLKRKNNESVDKGDQSVKQKGMRRQADESTDESHRSVYARQPVHSPKSGNGVSQLNGKASIIRNGKKKE